MKRYKVRLLPSAKNDMVQARKWYKQHSPLLPKRFTLQVDMAIKRISEAPFAYTIRYKQVHIANINVFPYAIHFLVIDDTVVIHCYTSYGNKPR